MELKLFRYNHGTEDTIGSLFLNGKYECRTLEDEFRKEKVPGETRIPDGTHEIQLRAAGGMHEKYLERFPEIHKGMLHLLDVPLFKFIYIHILNSEDQTDGCIGVGEDVQKMEDGRYRLLNSTVAYLRLYVKIIEALDRGEVVTITIESINMSRMPVSNHHRVALSIHPERVDLEDKKVTLPPENDVKQPQKKPGRKLWSGVKTLLKKRTFKTVLGIGAAALSVFTGINIQPFIEKPNTMEILSAFSPELIITVVAGILTFLVGLFVKKPGTKAFIESRIQAVAPEIRKALDEKSDGAKSITSGEIASILRAAFSPKKQGQ